MADIFFFKICIFLTEKFLGPNVINLGSLISNLVRKRECNNGVKSVAEILFFFRIENFSVYRKLETQDVHFNSTSSHI